MVHYEPVQILITTPALAEVILEVLVRHHGSPAFHPHTDGQTERQNYTIEPSNHAQELQKRANDKGAKPKSYAPGDTVYS